MNPSSTDEPGRRIRRRSSDNHYSALSITADAPEIAQTMSTMAQNREGQDYEQAIDRKDCRFDVKLSEGDKKQGRRHSLGAYNPPALVHSSRSGTLPMLYGVTRRRNSEGIAPSSFRVLRQENELQTNQRGGQLNKTKSEDNTRPQNGTSLGFKERKHSLLLNPSLRSGTGAGKTLKSRESAAKSPKGLRKDLNQKSNPKTNQLTKLNVEEKRNDLDRRIKIFNQNMDQFNQNNATKCRKISLEKPSNTSAIVKTDIPRSLSLPVVFQSYSDLDFQRLSPAEKNSFASLRHCRYLRIPAPPELTIKEVFQQQNKKEKVDKRTKFTRK